MNENEELKRYLLSQNSETIEKLIQQWEFDDMDNKNLNIPWKSNRRKISLAKKIYKFKLEQEILLEKLRE